MTVADFGAGGGFILASLNVKGKIAIEPNNKASGFIHETSPDIVVYKYPEDVPSGTVDLLISRHALEHMECPITELREMRKALKPNAKAVSYSSHVRPGIGSALRRIF